MSTSDFGPYRATALWNEAVITFRDGIHLTEHRHLFHKHKNCFTGSEAVRFLHKCLRTNALFNPDITREQTKQLLNQFFNADLIRRVKDCSSNNDGRFRDSSKYIYEFTEKMRTFKGNLPLTSINNRLKTMNSRTPSLNGTDKENDDNQWINQIIKRIRDMLNPLDVSGLLPTDKIEAKWVVTNASPEWVKIKWNTELPHWILSAIHNLINCASNSNTSDTYPEFEIELFKIISDYFATGEKPLICDFLYDLMINIYLYFDSLNNLIVDKLHPGMTASQENLLDCISSPRKKSNALKMTDMKEMANSCLEMAFTSDDPVMRVVPQRSYDIVHLKGNSGFTSKSVYDESKVYDIVSLDRKPLQTVTKNDSKNRKNHKDSSTASYGGIDNAAFSFFSPKSLHQSSHSHENPKSSPQYGRYLRSISSDNLDNIHVYVNHGLNYSVDDCDDTLDYKYAMESVDKLLRVSQSKKSLSSEDVTESFYTASSSSNADLFEANSYENVVFKDLDGLNELNNKEWKMPITKMCRSVYQLVLMLIPPNNRAQLKHLMRILHVVPRSSKLHQLSFRQMVSQLVGVILKPASSTADSACDDNVPISIIQFLTLHHEEIFSELPASTIAEIKNELSFSNKKENFVYCKRISGQKFEEQKVNVSRSALDELFDQILTNKALSNKERKKHLKMFKEYYPDIYFSHINAECQTSTKKSQLRI